MLNFDIKMKSHDIHLTKILIAIFIMLIGTSIALFFTSTFSRWCLDHPFIRNISIGSSVAFLLFSYFHLKKLYIDYQVHSIHKAILELNRSTRFEDADEDRKLSELAVKYNSLVDKYLEVCKENSKLKKDNEEKKKDDNHTTCSVDA